MVRVARFIFFFVGLWLGGSAPAARAHWLNMTRVALAVAPDGGVVVTIGVDLSLATGSDAAHARLISGTPEEQQRAKAELAGKLADWLTFRAGEHLLSLTFVRWQLPDLPPEKIGDLTVAAMTTFEFSGTLPDGADRVRLVTRPGAAIEFPVAFTVAVPGADFTVTRWVELPGTESREMHLPAQAAGEALAVAGVAPEPGKASEESRPGPIETAGQFLWLGFLHIMPQGADHILFVLGLFFLGLGWRPLLAQTTVFTIAHTTTLGLSAYGIFSLPLRVVEPLIALSIACVALEDIFRPKLNAARLAVVFSFGLLHGLGFASSLSEVPMPRDQFFTALLAFNFGVDFGQIAVIGCAFLAVGWWRSRVWYRARVVVPSCAAIAGVGLFWAGQRTFM